MFDFLKKKPKTQSQVSKDVDRRTDETLELIESLKEKRERFLSTLGTGNEVRDRVMPPYRERVSSNG